MVRTKKAKKPKSNLPGDLPPDIITVCAPWLSIPLAKIYNKVLSTASWPSVWKQEYITVIPKTRRPETLAECRNIACTSFWSKLLESIMLDKLRSEIPPDPMQFGGLKGCGAPHFLATVWDKALDVLEDPGNAVNICSIDFSKAFNRVSHRECLSQLQALGVAARGGQVLPNK